MFFSLFWQVWGRAQQQWNGVCSWATDGRCCVDARRGAGPRARHRQLPLRGDRCGEHGGRRANAGAHVVRRCARDARRTTHQTRGAQQGGFVVDAIWVRDRSAAAKLMWLQIAWKTTDLGQRLARTESSGGMCGFGIGLRSLVKCKRQQCGQFWFVGSFFNDASQPAFGPSRQEIPNHRKVIAYFAFEGADYTDDVSERQFFFFSNELCRLAVTEHMWSVRLWAMPKRSAIPRRSKWLDNTMDK